MTPALADQVKSLRNVVGKVTKYKTIIYDFDGTIADTLPVSLDIVNKHALEFGSDGISPDELPRLRGVPIRFLMQEFGIHTTQLPKLISVVKKELSQRISDIQLFDGMEGLFWEVDNLGLEQGIITSNYVKNVTDLLTDEQEGFFKFIRSEKAIFGKHHKIEKVIKELGYKKEEVLYVGDEVRDIEACEKVGIDVVSVTWGLNSKEILQKHRPTYLVDAPSGILDIISS